MAGDTWLEAKCLPSAGAARASMKCRVPVLVLTLHFSAGGVRCCASDRPVPPGFVTTSWVPALPAPGTVPPEPAPPLGHQQECEEPRLL